MRACILMVIAIANSANAVLQLRSYQQTFGLDHLVCPDRHCSPSSADEQTTPWSERRASDRRTPVARELPSPPHTLSTTLQQCNHVKFCIGTSQTLVATAKSTSYDVATTQNATCYLTNLFVKTIK